MPSALSRLDQPWGPRRRALMSVCAAIWQVNSATAFIAAVTSACLLPWLCRRWHVRDTTLLFTGVQRPHPRRACLSRVSD